MRVLTVANETPSRPPLPGPGPSLVPAASHVCRSPARTVLASTRMAVPLSGRV